MKCAACFLAICAALLGGCEREQRRYDAAASPASGAGSAQMGTLHAGPAASAASASHDGASAVAATTGSAKAIRVLPGGQNPFEENAVAVASGKRLYRSYNCNGCHASGGGSIGPALMDDRWLYGPEPAQIVATILYGRPNGMPSFAGRIHEDEAWKIAAYVRSMSGQLRSDVAPSRGDGLSAGPPEQRRDREVPRQASEGPRR